VAKLHDNVIRNAVKEKKPSEEIEALISERMVETGYIDEEIKVLVSNKLRRKAEGLFLPVPGFGEGGMWETGDFSNLLYLTPSGITKLRGIIREETAARRKAVLEWVTPLVGIIGATTGLLAVIFTMT
jgi:hypothetical protein